MLSRREVPGRPRRAAASRGPDAAQLEEKREEDVEQEARQASQSRRRVRPSVDLHKRPDQHDDRTEACARPTRQRLAVRSYGNDTIGMMR